MTTRPREKLHWAVIAFLITASIGAGAELPVFSLQSRDVLRSNEIGFAQAQTQYIARFWLTPEAQSRLQSFGSSNYDKDVVIRYGSSIAVTSRWMVTQVAPSFSIARPTKDEAIRLASSLGLAHDWRLRFGARSFGLIENPLGKTALFCMSRRPVWTVPLSAIQCLLICLGGVLLAFLFIVLVRKGKRPYA